MSADSHQPMSGQEGFELPTPSAADQAKSLELIEQLVEGMHGAPIPFADYMATVLYHPTLGYYGSGQVAFGAGGDFITAPERSRFFTAGLAYEWRQARAADLGGEMLEIGAGSVRLAIDLLERLAAVDALPERYTILEIFPALAARQAENLRESLPPAVVERAQSRSQSVYPLFKQRRASASALPICAAVICSSTILRAPSPKSDPFAAAMLYHMCDNTSSRAVPSPNPYMLPSLICAGAWPRPAARRYQRKLSA